MLRIKHCLDLDDKKLNMHILLDADAMDCFSHIKNIVWYDLKQTNNFA